MQRRNALYIRLYTKCLYAKVKVFPYPFVRRGVPIREDTHSEPSAFAYTCTYTYTYVHIHIDIKVVPYTFVRRGLPVREDTYPPEPSACEVE